jgi:putative ABC transport system ATP-binding protein
MTGVGIPVTTHGLVHIYQTEGHEVAALSGIHLSIRSGEMVGLLGPSGAGKSTLLMLLGGLLSPSAGRIFLGATELTKASSHERAALACGEVSLMLQGAARNLLPYLSPRENIDFARQAAHRSRRDVPTVDEVVDAVGVRAVHRLPLSKVPAGDLPLVALGVTLASRPGLLLVDEPTSELDHRSRDRVIATLTRVNAATGTTIVLVTHDPEVAASMPRTVTIRDGRIGGEGRSGEQFAVVTADGFLPLPSHVLDRLPPGTLVELHDEDGAFRLLPREGPGRHGPSTGGPSTGGPSTGDGTRGGDRHADR